MGVRTEGNSTDGFPVDYRANMQRQSINLYLCSHLQAILELSIKLLASGTYTDVVRTSSFYIEWKKPGALMLKGDRS